MSPGVLRIYMALLILWQVDWSIGYHNRTTVDSFLSVTEVVLRTVDM